MESVGDESDEQERHLRPIEIALSESDDKIQLIEIELKSTKDHAEHLKFQYSNPVLDIDKTLTQCGLCHLRGHAQKRCVNGLCMGPHQCDDIDKHPLDKKQIVEANAKIKSRT